MGLYISKLWSVLEELTVGGVSSRILMLGLDAAGKTTVLYKLKFNENICTIPTIGFNVETVTPVKGVTFTVWDIGGQEKIRRLWEHYYRNAQGLIYIVDSADRERMKEASSELMGICASPEMTGVPVVVIANKQDLPGAAGTSEVADLLELRQLKDRKWYIHSACALTGEGIYEAMHEMARLVKENSR